MRSTTKPLKRLSGEFDLQVDQYACETKSLLAPFYLFDTFPPPSELSCLFVPSEAMEPTS